jgi:peroxiredoxin
MKTTVPEALHLSPGSQAPDFQFHTPWEGSANFYETIGSGSAVLIFQRYIGCPVCQMEMANLRNDFSLFRGKDVKVFVVLQSPPESVTAVTNREDWPFTILCDPDSRIFQLYAVEPGGLLRYLHPAGLVAAIKAVAQGNKHGKFEGQETQLPAAFIIGADRIVRYAYYGKTINDIPSPATLAANLKWRIGIPIAKRGRR